MSRKALNLFMRDAFYDRYIAAAYALDRLEPWLEVPLDGLVGRRLHRASASTVPHWPGLKHLQPQESAAYQAEARRIAERMCIARVHLDVYLWLDGRE